MQPRSTPAFTGATLNLSNGHAVVTVGIDCGPRILAYHTPHGSNILKPAPSAPPAPGAMARWGHRLWLSPVQEGHADLPDDLPVSHEIVHPHGVRLTAKEPDPFGLLKEISVTLDPEGTGVTVRHQATNAGKAPIEVSTWALSVMAPGGMAIIPQPPVGTHPHDALPNRKLILWPYTDLSDARYRLGRHFITLLQSPHGGPTKLGLEHREGWVGYLAKDALFIKVFDQPDSHAFPDLGCNLEIFANHEMLEIESLGPLRPLLPGDTAAHSERWFLIGGANKPTSLRESELSTWIVPHLQKLGIQ